MEIIPADTAYDENDVLVRDRSYGSNTMCLRKLDSVIYLSGYLHKSSPSLDDAHDCGKPWWKEPVMSDP